MNVIVSWFVCLNDPERWDGLAGLKVLMGSSVAKVGSLALLEFGVGYTGDLWVFGQALFGFSS